MRSPVYAAASAEEEEPAGAVEEPEVEPAGFLFMLAKPLVKPSVKPCITHLTKPLFSMARSVLRVSASTFLALAEPGASGECSPVRSGRCASWRPQRAARGARCEDFFGARVG